MRSPIGREPSPSPEHESIPFRTSWRNPVVNEFEIPISRGHTIADVVHNTALAAIVVGTVQSGDELDDQAWAMQFGVGRASIRDAFRRLELQGLTDRTVSRSRALRSFTDDEAQQEASEWALLHGMIARSLSARSRAAVAVALREAHDRSRDARAEDGQVASFEFYELLRDATPRIGLRTIASGAAYRCRLAGASPADQPDDETLQADLIEALAADDPLEAERILLQWADD